MPTTVNNASLTHRAALLGAALAIGLLFLGSASSQPGQPVEERQRAQDTLVFAVLGDSRSDLSLSTSNPTAPDTSCECQGSGTTRWLDWIDCNVLTATAQAIAQDPSKPKFSMFLGDIGRIGGKGVFDAFKCVMKPLAAGAPVYTAFGNHEVRNPGETGYVDKPTDLYTAQKIFREAFVTTDDSNWGLPASLLDEEDQSLAYAFLENNNLLIVLDSFYVHPFSDEDCDDGYLWKKGYYSDKQLVWLQDTLKNYASGADNTFVFSHQPAFNAYEGKREFYNKYDTESYVGDCGRPKKASSNTNWVLWALMDIYGVDAFFTGHSHFYHRWNVKGETFEFSQPDWSTDSTLAADFQEVLGSYPPATPGGWTTEIPQILIGSSGAPITDSCDHNTQSTCTLPECACLQAYSYAVIETTGTDIDIKVYAKTATETAFSEFEHLEKSDGEWSVVCSSNCS